MAGRQLAHPGERAQGRGNVVVGQVPPQRHRVERLRDPRVDQEGAQVGGEDQLLAVRPVEERLLAGAVAGQQQAAAWLVPDREGEHPVEVLHQVGAVLLVEVGDDLGVGLRLQPVALGGELLAELGRVVDLAVADRPDRTVLVGERRRRGGDVDDGQAAEAECAVGARLVALAVGAAVGHGPRHGVHQLPTLGVGSLTADDAHQSAHDLVASSGTDARFYRSGHASETGRCRAARRVASFASAC